jgi:hypothetical protein
MCLHRPINQAMLFYGQVIVKHLTEFSAGFTSISLGPWPGQARYSRIPEGGWMTAR